MMRRSITSLVLGLMVAGLWTASPAPLQAQDVNRYYHYPYYYFPHNYYPNQVKYPDPRVPFQPPPGYMAYPPFLDPEFRYELWQNHRYHRGYHFWLDQF